jgi:predicted ester cyclase
MILNLSNRQGTHMDIHHHNKEIIGKFRAALYDCHEARLEKQLREVFAPDCQIHLAYPFNDLNGPEALYHKAYQPLLTAIPDLERRDFIVMAGNDVTGNWIGCAGYYIGVFEHPWLDIPATLHPVAMRYHEFFRLIDDQIVEMQALWDIPQVMMQAKAWPISPSLGVEWLVPGPATQDGIITAPYNEKKAKASLQLVLDMLASLKKYAEHGVEAMGLEHYWHPRCNWYGPAGIGSNRRISGFRHRHQQPFLNAMPDRAVTGESIFIADDNYVGVTGWPNMKSTISGDGWLGIAPSNQEITMCSLDFWRCENNKIRENWVLVDILDVYHQIGVDVFARMRELTAARQIHKP